jgi:energy-coupling factor transporter transmembrane protein EcfT
MVNRHYASILKISRPLVCQASIFLLLIIFIMVTRGWVMICAIFDAAAGMYVHKQDPRKSTPVWPFAVIGLGFCFFLSPVFSG